MPGRRTPETTQQHQRVSSSWPVIIKSSNPKHAQHKNQLCAAGAKNGIPARKHEEAREKTRCTCGRGAEHTPRPIRYSATPPRPSPGPASCHTHKGLFRLQMGGEPSAKERPPKKPTERVEKGWFSTLIRLGALGHRRTRSRRFRRLVSRMWRGEDPVRPLEAHFGSPGAARRRVRSIADFMRNGRFVRFSSVSVPLRCWRGLRCDA